MFKAKENKTKPLGVYQATQHVPFPHPDESPFSKKFDPGNRQKIKRWVKGVDWYNFGVNEENVTKLFNALPELISKFRISVKEDLINQTIKLDDRLPKQYINAYKILDQI